MKSIVKQTWAGLRVLLALTVLLGVLYPLAVWGVSRIPGLHNQAEGSVVNENGQPVGSSLIGVDPVAADPDHDPWFHNRPQAVTADPKDSNNPLPPGDPSVSGASNKAADNPDLVKAVQARQDAIAKREGVSNDKVPADAVTASGSGLDPAISPAYAELQVPRVVRVTGLPEAKVRQLVADHTSGRGAGVLGEPTVNVLELNLAVRAAGGHA
ncbi:K(+)-transporting ATPase subunit C [Solihabitans fulvus]|uniref:Potassium-transporting ATPase KdpC subunit n=1 Tax=Solihabitans fulvus TaxID=1892852 RepID=A0A5B2WNN3_9PSEU|nr:K(+)-transporting ATPase subunit C [Solihabitans fulvus]KAA2253603.1 K(+)-transporting ATPase subunit C [Solihabitans fulvus]